MTSAIAAGLSLVDPTGRIILATTLLCLVLAVAANLVVSARYARMQRALEREDEPFGDALLARIFDGALAAARRSAGGGTQAIIEERFQSQLRPLLLAERFVRAATGLVIILGLLGTFYGLTLSIGRIVHLVSADTLGADVAGAVTTGLTHALSGMAVAFSNSLLGIVSAVILTVLGVFSNVTDRRVGLMLQIETRLDRQLVAPSEGAAGFGASVRTLDEVVARFEAALTTFADGSRDFREFNLHLKDNIQRMSLGFGDFSDTLKGQLLALKARDGR